MTIIKAQDCEPEYSEDRTMTTAEHRMRAYDLEREGLHQEAARELRLAIKAYPKHHAEAAIYVSDLARLKERAEAHERCSCGAGGCVEASERTHGDYRASML